MRELKFEKGERLIRPSGLGEDPHLNACFFTEGSFSLYADGYRRAAECIFAQIASEYFGQDTLVYPLFFNWRQFVELSLKGAIREGRALQGGKYEAPIGHDIKELWTEARRLFVAHWGEHEELSPAEEIIRQLSAADPGSFNFRYPLDKKSKPTVRVQPNMHLGHFHQTMLSLADFLDSVCFGLSSELQQKWEAEDAYRAETDGEVEEVYAY